MKGWPDSCKIIYGTRGDNNNKKMRSVKKSRNIIIALYARELYTRYVGGVCLGRYYWIVIINSPHSSSEPIHTVNQWTGTPWNMSSIWHTYIYIYLFICYIIRTKRGASTKIYFTDYRCARKKIDQKTLRVERINGL